MFAKYQQTTLVGKELSLVISHITLTKQQVKFEVTTRALVISQIPVAVSLIGMVIKKKSCSTQLSTKFQLLIKSEMLKITDFSCFQTSDVVFNMLINC